MEIVLEHDEVDRLVREALAARGVTIPADATVTVRQNHRRGTTIRLAYRWEGAAPREPKGRK